MRRETLSKNWQTITAFSIVAFFVFASILFNHPSLSLKSVVFGYGGGVGGGDTSPPAISNIEVVVVTEDEATITWTTNESSISWVVYGETTDYGEEVKTTAYTVSHSLILGDLSPGTLYHYLVKSKDINGNIGTYTDKTFTTLGAEEIPEGCECTDWVDDVCGGGTCEDTKMHQTRTCTPADCAIESQCVADLSCVEEKPISEMTVEELQGKINQILAIIAGLQAELNKLLGLPTYEEVPEGFTFEKNLSVGMSDPDVIYLKIILDREVDHESWTGTEYFGSKTKAAVITFQIKYKDDISVFAGYTIRGSGFVGPGTRAKLNGLLGS